MGLKLAAPVPEEPSVAAGGTWLEYIACDVQLVPFEDIRYTCSDCDGPLGVRYTSPPTWNDFEDCDVRCYNTALPFEEGISLPESAAPPHEVSRLEADVGVGTFYVKHEGMNPAGSFRNRGITADVRVTKELGVGYLACASTGNTSVAFVAYDARGGVEALVLLFVGKVAAGKIARTLFHDAHTLKIDGSFDSCLGCLLYMFPSPRDYREECG